MFRAINRQGIYLPAGEKLYMSSTLNLNCSVTGVEEREFQDEAINEINI
jgi:histidinol dehydrogenase